MINQIISSLQLACSRTIVSCIGTFIHSKTVSFCRKILTVLDCGRPIGKWSSILPNVTLWGWVTWHYSHKQIIHDYTLHQQTLENIQSAKYLGITIIENKDWGKHISDISSKATKILGFLRRNLAFAPRSTNEVAYKTLVCPKLEYAAPIWSPYCKTQIQQVEKVQRTAAHWTCRRWRNTSSVGEMLDELQWPTLKAPRDQSSLLFFHKIHCGIMSIDKDKYLTLSQSTRSTRSSHNSQYCRPQTYSDALKYSFSQGLFLIQIVWLYLWSQLRPQRSSGHSFW